MNKSLLCILCIECFLLLVVVVFHVCSFNSSFIQCMKLMELMKLMKYMKHSFHYLSLVLTWVKTRRNLWWDLFIQKNNKKENYKGSWTHCSNNLLDTLIMHIACVLDVSSFSQLILLIDSYFALHFEFPIFNYGTFRSSSLQLPFFVVVGGYITNKLLQCLYKQLNGLMHFKFRRMLT